MKKLLLTMMVLLASIGANAQKFALVDMEYILKNVPAYERANEQLNQVSKKWEGEVEVLTAGYDPVDLEGDLYRGPLLHEDLDGVQCLFELPGLLCACAGTDERKQHDGCQRFLEHASDIAKVTTDAIPKARMSARKSLGSPLL